jgi:hypothetical protein
MRGVVVAISIAAIACSAIARAEQTPDPNVQKADALTHEGTNHFRLNEFDAALKAYKEAYRLAPKSELLYDIGQCYRKLDEKQAALDSFKNFLQESTNEQQNASVRELVEKLEAAIREESAAKNAPPQGPITQTPPSPAKPLLGRIRVASVPDGATVRFDDDQKSRTGTTPVEFDDLSPGTRRVFIAKDGYGTVERNVDITAGGNAVVDIQLTPSATPDVTAAPPSMTPEEQHADKPVYKKWWFWTAVGAVAVVGLGVGLGVGLSSGPSAPSATTSNGTFRF